MADDDPYSDDSEFADDHAEREALRHAEAEERRLAALRALGHEGVLTTANAAQAQRVQAIARGRQARRRSLALRQEREAAAKAAAEAAAAKAAQDELTGGADDEMRAMAEAMGLPMGFGS